MSVIFTKFTYFPRDVSEMHTLLHSTELQLILRYEVVQAYGSVSRPTSHYEFPTFSSDFFSKMPHVSLASYFEIC